MTDLAALTAQLETAVEALEVAAVDGDLTGTLDDRIRLHALLSTLGWANGRLTIIADSVEQSIAADMPEPVEVDGVLWEPVRQWKRRGWRQDELRAAVNRWAHRSRVDLDTGEMVEPTTREVLADVWKCVQVATGRTKVLKDAGIRPDEYSEGDEVTRIKRWTP